MQSLAVEQFRSDFALRAKGERRALFELAQVKA
jgi:hypothetical protein